MYMHFVNYSLVLVENQKVLQVLMKVHYLGLRLFCNSYLTTSKYLDTQGCYLAAGMKVDLHSLQLLMTKM